MKNNFCLNFKLHTENNFIFIIFNCIPRINNLSDLITSSYFFNNFYLELFICVCDL